LQVRQLHAIQRLQFRDQSFNGKYMIPTFEEYLDIALQAGRPVGVYPGQYCTVIGRRSGCANSQNRVMSYEPPFRLARAAWDRNLARIQSGTGGIITIALGRQHVVH
jgi:hypothetical protein